MYLQVDQLGTGHKTSLKVLCPPNTEYSELLKNRDKISLPIGEYIQDDGVTRQGIKDPVSIDPNRVKIRYNEEGGIQMDGVIQLRRGVEDISLGEARYAQVRIKVGEDKYLKGMAMYSDDMPEGTDIIFNTNKHLGTSFGDVLKTTKDDPDNPFGATIRQREYIGADGKKHLSAINIVNEEGDWGNWKKSLSSQVLSKQPVSLAKELLDKDYQSRFKEFEEISSLTNPEVKKKLLESFADDCDAAASHLKAAAMPRQSSKVLLPFPDMKENEVYAPDYKDGETVVLIRFPHGGRFEIPTLTVNNKHKTANELIHNAKDAIGINPKVAERLSGADFDGDTVLIIPNTSGKIKTAEPLKKLKDFDPKEYYPAYDGMPKVSTKTGFYKQREMGAVSNLITDMTIKGADYDEIARAVRHSMVVIDAEKHNLNWRQSYEDNGIAELKAKYQGGARRGASTLVSKASSEARIPQRKQRTSIDPETGEKVYYETGATYVDKKGVVRLRTETVTKMSTVKDARELSSGTPIEEAYASYANSMKALGNRARKELISTPSSKYSPSAKETYREEVESLKAKLNIAKRNAPLERQAQLYANLTVAQKRRDNPDMTNEEVKRLKGQALEGGRRRVGASKKQIEITAREWEAIQAGAISSSRLSEILNNTNLDTVRTYATPRQSRGLSTSQLSRAKALLRSGATQAEVASQLGVSVSTLQKAVNE